MGLPVLTVRGNSFASRVAASLLHAVDLPGLVADDLASYESQAVTLATDGRERLEGCREHLWQNRRDLALFDNARLSRDLATLFQTMVDRWCAGELPAPIAASGGEVQVGRRTAVGLAC
jgi:predicted O-linked N-acetylglucosamine transferase (SPINDLY family)